jgi:hypothetical protein
MAQASPSLAQVVVRAANDKEFFQELLKIENNSNKLVDILDKANIKLSPADQQMLIHALYDRKKLDLNSVRLLQLIHGMMKGDEWIAGCCIW